MLIAFGDFGLLILVFLGLGLGVAASMAQWILDHILLVGCLFALKSWLIFRKAFWGDRRSPLLLKTTAFLLDIARNIGTVLCCAVLLDCVLSNGLLELFFGILLAIPVCGTFILAASEGTMMFVYTMMQEQDDGLDRRGLVKTAWCEVISIAALAVVALILRTC